jgi:hypothetical protein
MKDIKQVADQWPETLILVDIVDGLNRIRGNQSAYLKLLRMFAGEKFLDQISQEAELGGIEDLRKTNHSRAGRRNRQNLRSYPEFQWQQGASTRARSDRHLSADADGNWSNP